MIRNKRKFSLMLAVIMLLQIILPTALTIIINTNKAVAYSENTTGNKIRKVFDDGTVLVEDNTSAGYSVWVDRGENIVFNTTKLNRIWLVYQESNTTWSNNLYIPKSVEEIKFIKLDENDKWVNITDEEESKINFTGTIYYESTIDSSLPEVEGSAGAIFASKYNAKSHKAVLIKMGDNVYGLYDYEAKKLKVFGNGEMQDTTINYDSNGMWQPKYEYEKYVESIEVRDGVTSIGENRFAYLPNLISIKIAGSVTDIREEAFYNCENLVYVDLDEGVKSIREYAFSRCKSLYTINIPESVTSLGVGVFGCCNELSTIKFLNQSFNTNLGNNKIFIDSFDENKGSNLTIYCYSGSQTETKLKQDVEDNIYNRSIEFKNIYVPEPTCVIKNIELDDTGTMVNYDLEIQGKQLEAYSISFVENEECKVVTPSSEKITKENLEIFYAVAQENRLYIKVWYDNGKTKTFNPEIKIAENQNTYSITIDESKIEKIPSEGKGYVTVKIPASASNGKSIEYSFDKQNWFSVDPPLCVGAGSYSIWIRAKDETNEELWKKVIVTLTEEEWEKAKKAETTTTPEDEIEQDKVKPEISTIVVGDNAEPFYSDRFYIKGTMIFVEGYDDVSKYNVQYSFNGGEYSSNNIYQLTETENLVIKVKDEAGNQYEEVVEVSVDNTPPEIEYNVVTIDDRSEVYIDITVTDEESGVNQECIIQNDMTDEVIGEYDGFNTDETLAMVQITCNKNAIYEIITYDNAGNRESLLIPIYHIDEKAPVIGEVTGGNYLEDIEWINKDEIITINATDETLEGGWDKAGLKYCFDYNEETKTGTWQDENSKTFTEATENIKIAVKDKVGKVKVYEKTLRVPKIDKTLPELLLTVKANPDNNKKIGEITYTDKIILEIKATDNESGLLGEYNIFLSKNSDIEWDAGYVDGEDLKNGEKKEIIIDNIEAKNAVVSLKNNAGSYVEEFIDFSNIKIDKEAPELTITLKDQDGKVMETEGTETIKIKDNTKTYEKINININAKDEALGVDVENSYIIKQGTELGSEQQMPFPAIDEAGNANIECTENGTYIIVLKDLSGNEIRKDVYITNIGGNEPGEDTGDGTGDVTEDKLEVTSTKYEISGSYIKGIQPKTTIEQLLNNIQTNATTKEVYKGTTKVTDFATKAVTGMKIKTTLGSESKEYELVVKGDITGDGTADIYDIFAINKHRLGKTTLTGAKLLAGDVDTDGVADIYDIFAINKYRLGKTTNL